VLAYTLEGQNALVLDPEQNGRVYDPDDEDRVGPTGGRFDVGPEMTTPAHPMLWRGPWTPEITGAWSARMTSVEDDATGLQLVRDFELDPTSSRLACTQTMHNVSDRTVHVCHWSRTFGLGHGICVVPLTRPSRFPNSYIMYGPGPTMDFKPVDPNIARQHGYLVVLDTPQRPKLGLDSYAGWFAYLMPNDVAFVKKFPTYPDRVYNEMAALTISLWYFRDLVCELEPIGPREVLAPGESASFTETWWLVPYSFPNPRESVDPVSVAAVAQELVSQ
jgi:hypothetical protein